MSSKSSANNHSSSSSSSLSLKRKVQVVPQTPPSASATPAKQIKKEPAVEKLKVSNEQNHLRFFYKAQHRLFRLNVNIQLEKTILFEHV